MALAKAWSFSALQDYERCPYTVWHKANKSPILEEPPNRGTVIHEEAERFIKGDIEQLPASLKKFDEEFMRLREAYPTGLVHVEDKIGFTEQWQPCEWFDDSIWLRLAMDVMEFIPDHPEIVQVTDWKSGKSWGNDVAHIQQLQLYAIAVFMRYPDVTSVIARDCYLDEGKTRSKTYYRDEKFDRLFDKWNERAERMMTDEEPRPKPNRQNCRFCRWGVTNGSGACEYAVPWE